MVIIRKLIKHANPVSCLILSRVFFRDNVSRLRSRALGNLRTRVTFIIRLEVREVDLSMQTVL